MTKSNEITQIPFLQNERLFCVINVWNYVSYRVLIFQTVDSDLSEIILFLLDVTKIGLAKSFLSTIV